MTVQNRLSFPKVVTVELKIYIVALFDKDKYIVGNACDQIYTDDEFVHTNTM